MNDVQSNSFIIAEAGYFIMVPRILLKKAIHPEFD